MPSLPHGTSVNLLPLVDAPAHEVAVSVGGAFNGHRYTAYVKCDTCARFNGYAGGGENPEGASTAARRNVERLARREGFGVRFSYPTEN